MNRTPSLSLIALLSLALSAHLTACGADSGSGGGAGGAGGAGAGAGAGAGNADGGGAAGDADAGGGGGDAGGAENPAGGDAGGAGGDAGGGAGGDVGGDAGGADNGGAGGGVGDVEDVPDVALVDTAWGQTMVIDSLAIGGEGFDLDDDGRSDNALGAAGLFANPQIAEALATGDMLLTVDMRATNPSDDGPFHINMYAAEDTDDNLDNNFSGEGELAIDIRSFGADGKPRISFPDANIVAGLLSANTSEFELSFPVGEDGAEQLFKATLHQVKMEATVDGEFAGLISGKIGGAAREEEIRLAIQTFDLPEGTDEMIEGFLANPDFDTDGDGLNDAFTIALTFSATTCTFASEFANVPE